MNSLLTPSEAVAHIFRKIDDLTDQGVCERCALRLMAIEYKISYHRLLTLYLDRSLHEQPA